MTSVDTKILNRVRGLGKGSVFTTGTFLDLGSRTAVDKALSRLAQKGSLRRLARGLYDYPKSLPILGVLAPDPNTVVKTLSDKYGIRVQSTGAYAANLLGLDRDKKKLLADIAYAPTWVGAHLRRIAMGGT